MQTREHQWKHLGHLLAELGKVLVEVQDMVEDLAETDHVGHTGLGDLALVIFHAKGHSVSDITVQSTDSPFGATVTFLDANGASTQPNDVPQWSSDNDAAASVVAADDGLSATVTVAGAGVANIAVSSTDADGTVVTGSGAVTVEEVGPPPPGPAVSATVDFTPPGA